MEFWGAENLDEAQGSVYGKLYKNWSKEDVTQTNCVAFYATNKEVAKAIERGRDAIVKVDDMLSGATLYFEANRGRPLSTVIRPSKSKTRSNSDEN